MRTAPEFIGDRRLARPEASGSVAPPPLPPRTVHRTAFRPFLQLKTLSPYEVGRAGDWPTWCALQRSETLLRC